MRIFIPEGIKIVNLEFSGKIFWRWLTIIKEAKKLSNLSQKFYKNTCDK